ncbi:coiled-coil and C2 domain-containing protein 2A isoform X2 [Histomonas meleagridis]|uniref:coiled-coil and C2 domain-containing protein 2A isoform X2 n=1 Tax=Histomonas meleagridis TaxID=135588 RepID=UPI00355AC4C4|nr:coiled-coil and C2 domain-containing protein 2A isoform X2 [Histomonas meleagridis]KAH0800012.1 coiled-coil and C2 domain-containing protein 2A isoform X2 [Histomonas meleagridis]
MADSNEVLARSNELLARVRQQINEGPTFLRELAQPQRTPVSVPFMPNTISLDESFRSTQDINESRPQPSQPQNESTTMNAETVNRLKDLFRRQMSQLQSPLTKNVAAEQESNKSESSNDLDEEISQLELEDEPKFIEPQPILDQPFVIINRKTTTNEPDQPLLSQANVAYPLQNDDVPLVSGSDIAEDGLWVPDLPLCKPENVRRLEYRLLWDDPRREFYFGADYGMKVDTPPLTQIPPPFPLEPITHRGYEDINYAPASVWGIEDVDITRSFKIEVTNVQFFVHPLSSSEDILSMKIRQLYTAYVKDQELSRVHYYKDRIQAIRKALNTEENTEKQYEYYKQLKEAREMRDMEEHNSRMIRESLIQAWQELKKIRTNNSFTSTSLSLKWQSRKYSEEEKQLEEKAFEEDLKRRTQEEMKLAEFEGKKLNSDEVMKQLHDRHVELGLRMPGDSQWKPILSNNAEVTPFEECTKEEQERRQTITEAKIYIKIFINNDETTKTNEYPLDSTFRCDFKAGTQFKTTVIPQKISLQLWETGYIKRPRYISTIVLPITIGTNPEFNSFEFTSDFTNDEGQLIMGTINARCFIEPDPNTELFLRCPDVQVQKTKRRLAADPSSFMSVPYLLKYIDSHDPNDPYTTAMTTSILAQRNAERVVGKFRLDSQINATTFESLVPTTVGMQLQNRIKKLQEMDEKQMQKKKEKPKDFIEKLKENELVQSTTVSTNVQLSDVVREAPMPTVPAVFTFFKNIIGMYRPLKPIRIQRTTSTKIEAYSKLVIRIVRAMNIPERTKLGTGPGTVSSLIYSSTKDSNTNIYCKVTYLKQSKKTRVVQGKNAEWNQSFEFPISNDQDQVPNLEDVAKLNLRIDLFDEISFQVISDDREEQMKHELIEPRFLGSLVIPISSIWATGIIDGIVSINEPCFQLGYSKPEDPFRMSLYLTLDPPIIIPDFVGDLGSGENEAVILRAKNWLIKMNEMKFKKKRRIILMAYPKNAKPIIACRMVRKQNPPDGFNTPLQLLRFVSMIPNASDAEVFNTINDVWFTSGQFLSLNAGDEEEHALLLCNTFKSIGLDSYVALGYDLINGKHAFVITKESGRITLWDPIMGRCWNSKDRFCSFYNIGIIFNEENVWANIQSDVEPYKVDWNIHNNKLWYPFFSSDFKMPPLDSPQEDHLEYKQTDDSLARRTERELDNAIKSAVERWREHQRTSWNPQFAEKLRSALETCERAALNDPNTNYQTIIDNLASQYTSYRMNGGPFCMTFTTIDDVINEVSLQEVWKTESPSTDFALGVYVVPYPNGILVVWVILACLQYIQEAHPPL